MKRHYFSLVLFSVIIVVFTVLMTYWINIGQFFVLSDIEKLSSIIQIWTISAAFLTAIFIILTYWITSKTFWDSKKPFLFLFALNSKIKDTENHTTVIHYQNNSGNPFFDLTILVRVFTKDKSVELNQLFSPKMYMAPTDKRSRWFITTNELKKNKILILKRF